MESKRVSLKLPWIEYISGAHINLFDGTFGIYVSKSNGKWMSSFSIMNYPRGEYFIEDNAKSKEAAMKITEQWIKAKCTLLLEQLNG